MKLWNYFHIKLIFVILKRSGSILPSFFKIITHNSAQKCHDNQLSNFRGLSNVGNTCYMNSVIQALFRCSLFRQRIIDSTFSKGSAGSNLQKLFTLLQSSEEESIELAGKSLCRQIAQSMSIDVRIQEDAEEFFLRLLDIVDLGLENNGPKLSSIFDMKLEQCIRCIDVDHMKLRTQKYFDLSIDIPWGNGEEVANLTTSLHNIFQSELMKGENQYKTKDHGLQDAEKTVSVKSFPQTLVVHLKRFAYDVESNKMSKVMTPVSIPRTVDLSRFKQTVDDKLEGRYELSSIVVHEGWRLDFGHYYLLAKQSEGLQSERWVQLNDHLVSEALSAEHVDLYASKGAYLLFYSQCREEGEEGAQGSR